ncbi:hypothetical protein ONZ45_g10034 [Pleurotus djamor]|nr:hypothetical protein ONZ45_g10034 [Pleurotus djamor]
MITAKWFGFNGLVLEILSSSFGSLELISRYQSIHKAEQDLALIQEAYHLLSNKLSSMKERVESSVEPLDGYDLDIAYVDADAATFESLVQKISSLYSRPAAKHGLVDRFMGLPSMRHSLPQESLLPPSATWPILRPFSEVPVSPLILERRNGMLPIVDSMTVPFMALAVVFLLISVIAQAFAAQTHILEIERL